jgi:hypothetical protein
MLAILIILQWTPGFVEPVAMTLTSVIPVELGTRYPERTDKIHALYAVARRIRHVVGEVPTER